MNGYEKRTKLKKEAIMQAAQELFFQKGVIDTGIAEIAAKAKVSQVTIYNYFESKENLLREVMVEYMGKAIGEAEKILELELPFEEKMKFFFSMGEKGQSEMSQSFFNSIAWEDPNLQALYKEIAATKAIPFLYRFFEMGRKEGAIHESIPAEAFMAYLGAFMPIMTNPAYLKTGREYKEGLNRLFYYGLFGK